MNKLYFVNLYGEYQSGSAVISAEDKDEALKIARKEFTNKSGWYEVDMEDIELLKTSKTGLVAFQYHAE